MKTLIVVAHPGITNSNVNKKWVDELSKHPDKFTVHQLYEVYPDEKIDLTTSLKQTRWQGVYYEGNTPKAHIGLVFYTEERGYCDQNPDDEMTENDYFNYKLDEKLLVIKGSRAQGNWLITSKSKKKMILEKGTGANLSIKAIMVLEREN